MEELTILIVDDIEENIQILREFLDEYGYTIIAANNGVDALERLEEQQIHLIITDAMMPKMDGFQLCRKVKEHPRYSAIPFIMYTGDYIDEEDREFAKSIGVDKYIVKSEGFKELITTANDIALNWYGYSQKETETQNETIDDSLFLEKHHSILVKKLEEKMQHLEHYAETLNRKNIELKASEARYRSLFENANIGVVILNRETKRILDANKQAVHMLKYSKKELLEKDCLPIQGDEKMTLRLLYSELFFSGEAAIIDKEGSSIEVHISSVPIAHAQDPRIIVYIRDLSEHAKIRQKLLQVENMTMMGRLAAGIAHEIRNPLAAITVNLQYLQNRYADNEDIMSTVEMAMDGSKRVEQVIDKTLSLARATPPQTNSEDVHKIITRVLWFMKMPLQQKNITIYKKFSEELPKISVDEKQIQQVLLNIIQNAVDASKENSTITLTTGIRGKNGEKIVCIEVADQGEGIPKNVQDHIFEPFNTTKKSGTGLGLAISKYIMDRHNGNIILSSDPGRGTAVRLEFSIY